MSLILMGTTLSVGKISVQSGRDPAKTAELYTFRLATPKP